MSIAHLLEDFSSQQSNRMTDGTTEVLKEEQRLEAFEQGYKAGWDDASKAQSDTNGQLSAELVRNFQDLSFTYHEAFSHVMKAMNPLLQQIVEAVLPELAQQTIGHRVVEQLRDMAKTVGDQPASLVIAPCNRDKVEEALDQDLPIKVELREDPSLSEGEVHLKLGDSERQIDMDEVLAGIGQAVAGFFQEHEKERKHG